VNEHFEKPSSSARILHPGDLCGGGPRVKKLNKELPSELWPGLQQFYSHLERTLELSAQIGEVGAELDEWDQIPQELREQFLEHLDGIIHLVPVQQELGLRYLAQLRKHQELRAVSLVARRLPEEIREEWLGDLQEARWKLIEANYPWWAVSLITWKQLALLFWSLIQMKYQDLGF
jgi:hypothetical protein